MSYILDALKKADSERQHGKMPDIYSRQPSSDTLENEESTWSKPIIWFLLAVIVVLLGAALLFNTVFRTQPAVIVVPAQVASQPVAAAVANIPVVPALQSSAAAPVPVAAPAPASPPVAPSTPPPASAEAPAPATPATTEPVNLQASSKTSIPAAKEQHAQHHATESASHASKKAAPTKDADLAIETVSTTLRDLPLNIQNEIPTVTVGGYIYSSKREDCQLLINKLLLREGEQVAPGLKLERMMPHSAILSYKGYRYRISY